MTTICAGQAWTAATGSRRRAGKKVRGDPSARRVNWRIGHCEEMRVVRGGTTWIHITHAADGRDTVRYAPW
jgi:hypothetical protein